MSQIKWDWASQYVTEPVFTAPLVYVHEPDAHSGTPFFKHNHQPALTWCDNGDLLAVWFSTNEEKGVRWWCSLRVCVPEAVNGRSPVCFIR